MMFFPALLVKLTLILAAGLTVAAVLRSAAPAFRHLVLLATLVCGLTLPAAMLVSPRWDVAILPQSSVPPLASTVVSKANGQVAGGAMDADVTPTSRSVPLSPSASRAVDASVGVSASRSFVSDVADRGAFAAPLIWALGFLAIVAWLVVGRIRLRRLARCASPLTGADWQQILEATRAEAGVTREVQLFASSVATTPLTWGSFTPVILLPEDSVDWTEEHRRVVLRHELAHIARRDSLAHLVAGFVCALYWFHPLVWMAERRLRAECERACDDRVVSLGTPATEYASHLLEVARSARAFGAPGFLSVAMARPSQLEGRLLAVLNQSHHRIIVSRGAKSIAVSISVLMMLPLAAFRPVAQPKPASAPRPAVIRPPILVEHRPGLVTPPLATNDDLSSEPRSVGKVVNTDRNEADTTFQLSGPAREGGTLELDLRTGGGVTITSWDQPQVSVRALLSGRNWRDTRVSLQPSNGNVSLESDFVRSSNNQSTSHHFDIQVPRRYNVRIKSAGGGISIENLSGRFVGNTGGGNITIRKANGEVHLATGGGEINVTDSNLEGRVSTGGGLVRIMRVNGSLKGTSGSGPVIYTDSRDPKQGASESASNESSVSTTTDDKTTTTYVDNSAGKGYGYGAGAIRMSAAGGALSLPSAPGGARVTTGGGHIYIGPSGGEVYAQTGGGPIDIGPATGSVAATTGAGDVSIELKGSDSHRVDVTSGKGQIVLVVPADLNATLELEAAYTNNFGGKTRIISDFPLSITETSDWDSSQGTPRKYVRARQNIGRGGAVIRVKTVNGNVVLKRAGG
jgi:beta-lactamase regulating signal transducer with metallopeptidase domain/DUF4097 and DUF4098 domain-containing protein YvlB